MNFDEIIKTIIVRTTCNRITGSGVLLDTGSKTHVYVLTAKHNVFGTKFDIAVVVNDFSFELYSPNKKINKSYSTVPSDIFILPEDEKLDLMAVKVDRERLEKLSGKLPFIELATINERDNEITFRGYPAYAKAQPKSFKATIAFGDYETPDYQFSVPVAFTDFIGSQPIENVKGFSGGGVFSGKNDRVFLHGIITDYEGVDGRFTAIDSNAIQSLLKNEARIGLFEPWIEQLLSRNQEEERLSRSAKLLGPRYTRKHHFPVDLDRVMGIMERNESFLTEIDDNVRPLRDILYDFKVWREVHGANFDLRFGRGFLTKNSYKTILKKISLQNAVKGFYIDIDDLLRLCSIDIFRSGVPADFDELNDGLIGITDQSMVFIDHLSKFSLSGIPETKYKEAISILIELCSRLRDSATQLRIELLKIVPYFGTSFLMIRGKAGSGKSQLLANSATHCFKQGNPVVLILGQQLRKGDDPYSQILEELGLSCSWETFLTGMNRKAALTGKAAFIFIDALNEGNGLRLWNTYLESFVRKLDDYPLIKLCVSYRASFETSLFEGQNLHPYQTIDHEGFAGRELAAMNYFFDAFGVKLHLARPLKEFSNPLFLRLFCLAYARQTELRDIDSSAGILFIFKRFIRHVNDLLGSENKYDYRPERLNLVQKGVDIFVQELIRKEHQSLTYEEAYITVDKEVGSFLSKKGFIDGMIDEEVFYENLERIDGEEVVILDFAYQKFGDHLIIQYLLKGLSRNDLNTELKSTGRIGRFFDTLEKREHNGNLLEALTIQVSDKYEINLIEAAPFLQEDPKAIIAYILSLTEVQVKYELTSERRKFIERYILPFEEYRLPFYSQLISLSDSDSAFNAEFLHDYLRPLTMAKRDEVWTSFLHGQYFEITDGTPIHSIINKIMGIVPESMLPTGQTLLWGTTLSWFLVSTNRRLRDRSTKALVWLYTDRLGDLLSLLKKFDGIDEPYVQQRLYAAALGAALRSHVTAALFDLCDYTFENIFSKKEVPADVLLRDYASSILEYGLFNQWKTDVKPAQFRPPYRSQRITEFPENAVVDSRLREPATGAYTLEELSVLRLLKSMVTEYGRGVSNYGDFGRYVFDRAVRHWKEMDSNKLSNAAVEMIFTKYGFDPGLHAEIDGNEEGGRSKHYPFRERIGKKYQWIALFEILARLSDHEKFFEEPSDKKPGIYRGTWNPFVRDIDPTAVKFPLFLFNLTERHKQWFDLPEYNNWQGSDKDWISYRKNWPEKKGMVIRSDETNTEWLTLQASPSWSYNPTKSEKRTDRRLFLQVKSFLVPTEEKSNWIKYLAAGRDWPFDLHQTPHNYKLFSREYYWSAAYETQRQELQGSVYYLENQSPIPAQWMMRTATEYSWEAEEDYSLERKLNFLKPSAELVSIMDVKPGHTDGELVNEDGITICFDPLERYDRESMLLVRKDTLIKALKRHDMDIIWTMYGEKQITGLQTDNSFQGYKVVAMLDRNGQFRFRERIITERE